MGACFPRDLADFSQWVRGRQRGEDAVMAKWSRGGSGSALLDAQPRVGPNSGAALLLAIWPIK